MSSVRILVYLLRRRSTFRGARYARRYFKSELGPPGFNLQPTLFVQRLIPRLILLAVGRIPLRWVQVQPIQRISLPFLVAVGLGFRIPAALDQRALGLLKGHAGCDSAGDLLVRVWSI